MPALDLRPSRDPPGPGSWRLWEDQSCEQNGSAGLGCQQDSLWPNLGAWLPVGDEAGAHRRPGGCLETAGEVVPTVTWPGSARLKACCGVGRGSTLSRMALPPRSDATFSTSLS